MAERAHQWRMVSDKMSSGCRGSARLEARKTSNPRHVRVRTAYQLRRARVFTSCTLTSVWVSKRRLNGENNLAPAVFGERFFADDTAVLVRELSRVARRVAGAAKYPKVT